jgi:hypothetical protein
MGGPMWCSDGGGSKWCGSGYGIPDGYFRLATEEEITKTYNQRKYSDDDPYGEEDWDEIREKINLLDPYGEEEWDEYRMSDKQINFDEEDKEILLRRNYKISNDNMSYKTFIVTNWEEMGKNKNIVVVKFTEKNTNNVFYRGVLSNINGTIKRSENHTLINVINDLEDVL